MLNIKTSQIILTSSFEAIVLFKKINLILSSSNFSIRVKIELQSVQYDRDQMSHCLDTILNYASYHGRNLRVKFILLQN